MIGRRMCDVIKSDVGYLVAFFGAFQIRMIQIIMVVCMLLWVTSFVDSGYLDSEADAKRLYQNLFLVGVGCTAIIAPLVIRMSDHWHLGWSIGISFLLRSIVYMFGFPMMKVPDGFWTYVLVTTMLACTAA